MNKDEMEVAIALAHKIGKTVNGGKAPTVLWALATCLGVVLEQAMRDEERRLTFTLDTTVPTIFAAANVSCEVSVYYNDDMVPECFVGAANSTH